MICESCGGKYDDHLMLCPYCGSENMACAVEEQQDYIENYEEKKKNLDKVPGEIAKKASRHVVRIAAVLTVVFLAVLGIVWAVSRISADRALEKQQKQIQKLEEYYQSGDYHGMSEYLEESGAYGVSYRKYDQMSEIYDRFELIRGTMESCRETMDIYVRDQDTERALHLVIWDLSDCFSQLKQIRGIEEEGFPYGNEDGMREVESRYREILESRYLLNEEEIEEGISRYEDSQTDYTDMAEDALQRMMRLGGTDEM